MQPGGPELLICHQEKCLQHIELVTLLHRTPLLGEVMVPFVRPVDFLHNEMGGRISSPGRIEEFAFILQEYRPFLSEYFLRSGEL